MTALYTSTRFASAAAEGVDWRDACKKVLEALSTARTPGDGFNIGFLYFSDLLAEDAQSILGLFKSVTGIDNWIGSCGMAVAGCGEAFVDKPAVAAMIGHVDDGHIKIFAAETADHHDVRKAMKPWLERHEPMLTLLHGNSFERHPDFSISLIAQYLGGFVAGGLTSARGKHIHIAHELHDAGFSGAAFSSDVAVSAAMSQGCVPISGIMTATKADGHVIMEIDGKKPFDVFSDTLREMAKTKTGQDPNDVLLDMAGGAPDIPDTLRNLFKGEVHIALPVAGSDTKDYMVRDIVGIDPDEGVMAVAHKIENGDRIMLVHRDDDTVRADLSQTLVALRERVIHERGTFNPLGALYFTCVARAQLPFTGDGRDEMALVREIIGDVPLAGFYANGEIAGGRLYRYTGVLILFV